MALALARPDLRASTSAPRRRPAVRRRRRPALVARAGRPRACARAARTTCSGCRTPSPTTSTHDRRRRPSSTSSVPFLEAPPLAPDEPGGLSAARRVAAAGARCSSTASARSTRALTVGRPRPAAHRQRRLERRHEPRRAPTGAARARGSASSCTRCSTRSRRSARRAATARARRATGTRRAACATMLELQLGRRVVLAAATTTTARRSARRRTTSAGSTRSRSRGRCSPAPCRSAFAERAMDAVRAHLIRRGVAGSSCCSTPPSTTSAQDPGYIKGYPPGIRENGGQYTHAAVWVVMALARLGQRRRGVGAVPHAQPDQPHADGRPTSSATRPSPTCSPATSTRSRPHAGPRRLDLVHGVGGLDVPRRPRKHPRPAATGRRRSQIDPVHPVDLARAARSPGASARRATRSPVVNPQRRCRGIADADARRRARRPVMPCRSATTARRIRCVSCSAIGSPASRTPSRVKSSNARRAVKTR